MFRIDANHLSFNVSIEGDGPPVLLLHGFPDSLRLWDRITPALKQSGYKVIAYDQRGYGESDAPENRSSYHWQHLLSDAVKLVEKLCPDQKIRLVGHDWGAVVGWLLCINHPELVERYVAVSVGHPLAYRYAGLQQKLKGWYALAFLIPRLAEAMISANDFSVLRRMAGNKEEREQRVKDFSRKGRLTAALNWYRANLPTFAFSHFGCSKVPTLGIYSRGDVALTEDQMTASAKYMNAEWKYICLEDASHWIPLDKPEELSELIIDWFGESQNDLP